MEENQTVNTQEKSRVVSFGDWMITLLITFIPIVNIVMLFVWAFSGGTNPNKSNWAKAALLWMAISIVIWLIFGAIFGAAMWSFGQ